MPIQMALRPKARICGAYPAIGYGRINVFGHSLSIFKQNDSVKLIVKDKSSKSIFNMGEVDCRGFVKDMRCIKGHSFDFGGGWINAAVDCSMSCRFYWYPFHTDSILGFRLARSAQD